MQTRIWTHPTTGETRRYLDSHEVWDLMPATTPYGYPYKGADMDRILAAKFWIDEVGALHIDRLVERGRIDAAEIRRTVEAAL